MPDMLNWFGWCTWDAFYTDVTAEGVKQGLERYFTVLWSPPVLIFKFQATFDVIFLQLTERWNLP